MNIITIIDAFITGSICANDFEKKYLIEWRRLRDNSELNDINSELISKLGRIFTVLDMYCADASLREAGDLNDEDLLTKVMEIFREFDLNQ